MKSLYVCQATADGFREGRVRTNDGRLNVMLSRPSGMNGDDGPGTNPEQLFAAAYAACFHSAMRRAARRHKLSMEGSEVTAVVDLGLDDDRNHAFEVELIATVPELDRDQIEQLMADAHQICPYSRATRGNVAVTLTAKA
jgi:osmotically inducible protein OsmC